jgi:predicted RNase H-like HicB family nuclease
VVEVTDAYRVVARRAGNWWALEVPDLPGVFSQVRRLDKADDSAREAIALRLDVEPEDITVSVEPELPDAARRALAQVEEAKQAAQQAADAAQAAMKQAADVLTRELSQRDAGRILGVSFQRIGQLKKAS